MFWSPGLLRSCSLPSGWLPKSIWEVAPDDDRHECAAARRFRRALSESLCIDGDRPASRILGHRPELDLATAIGGISRRASHTIRFDIQQPEELKCHLGRLAEPYAIGPGRRMENLLRRKGSPAWSKRNAQRPNHATCPRQGLGGVQRAAGRRGGVAEISPARLQSRRSRDYLWTDCGGERPAGLCPGCKPLRGTERLDEFMTALGLDFAARAPKFPI